MDTTTPIDVQPIRIFRSSTVDGYPNQTGDSPSLPMMDPNPGAIVLYTGSNNSFGVDVHAGPSTITTAKRGRGRPRGSKNKNSTPATKKVKLNDPNRRFIKPCSGFNSEITQADKENGNHMLVDSVLMRFDAVRRRFCQLGNVTGLLTSASTNCIRLGVRTNIKKRIGPVPGIEIGDIFYFWGEMYLVGLHLQPVAGIDYLSKKDGATEGQLATSVVTSGCYDDSVEGVNRLVYTGHGGKDKKGVPCDQKLGRGNLAMTESYKKGNDIRVIRGVEDPNNPGKKIYIYDGLYIVVGFSKVKDENDCEQFKFTLERKPDQPPGYAVWKEIERWKTTGVSRNGLILDDLSNRTETLPIPVVNDVNESDKTLPESFNYERSFYLNDLDLQDRPVITCSNCEGQSCSTNVLDCVCVQINGGELPYHDQILVCRRPMIQECGHTCGCSILECSNRMVQRGLKLNLEVFMTETRGWGLRSREPIRAGTFICEFSGMSTMGERREDDEYVFDTSRVYKDFQWNYEHELTCEDVSEKVSEVFELNPHMVISAKSSGNIGRFMNHSCNPNVFWQPVETTRNKEVHLFIAFFAKKHIPPLTELTYDYGFSIPTGETGEDGSSSGRGYKGKKTCLCGSVNCCGSFG